jgi:hypothetical protein
MRATLTFNLPDDQVDYTHASKGAAYHNVLTELVAAFRMQRKYDGPVVTEEAFYALLDDCDVTIE